MNHPKNRLERKNVGVLKGIKRTNSYTKTNTYLPHNVDYYEWKKEVQKKRRNTTKECSCIGCGNPRKWFEEITLKEKRFLDGIPDQFK